jgi:hypothetical protein
MFGKSQQKRKKMTHETPEKCIARVIEKRKVTPTPTSTWCEIEKAPLTMRDAAVLDIDVMDSGKILVGMRTKTYEDCEEYQIYQTMFESDRLGLLSCAMAICATLDNSLSLGELKDDYGQLGWKSANSELAISVDLVKYRAMCDYDRREVMYLIWSMLGDGSKRRSADALSGVLVAMGIL